jgi:hypothetical protein
MEREKFIGTRLFLANPRQNIEPRTRNKLKFGRMQNISVSSSTLDPRNFGIELPDQNNLFKTGGSAVPTVLL